MDAKIRRRFLPVTGLVLAACLSGWSGSAPAQTAPAAGRLLVATRHTGGVFSKSVVLLLGYGPGGAMGLIVNRPTRVKLSRAIPNVTELQNRNDAIYLGGPVALGRVTLLIRTKSPPPGAMHVFEDVYASASLHSLRAAAGNTSGRAQFRAYAGYAGWGAGQLDAEIQRGDWIVSPGSVEAVFSTHPSRLWRELIRRANLRLVRVRDPALADPSL